MEKITLDPVLLVIVNVDSPGTLNRVSRIRRNE
jgi:hypothetical protein